MPAPDFRLSGSVSVALADPHAGGYLAVDAAFRKEHQPNLDWLLDRLSKSTAGVRGFLTERTGLNSITLADADQTSQLSPTVVAVIAQAYADYLWERARERAVEEGRDPEGARPGAFVGYDPRFLSPEFGELFTRIFAGNGVRVVRDHRQEPTPTPVSSFMSILLGLDSGIQITASHNPANQNGIKSSTSYGGVDTDDISDRIAGKIEALLGGSGQIRIAPRDTDGVEIVDAKGLYAARYLAATFRAEDLAPLREAVAAGTQFLFDGLHGVGGLAMRRYLDHLLPGVDWSAAVPLLNDLPDPAIGGIATPDPSNPKTLEVSGAIDYLAAHPEVRVSVTADMDADRIGTAVLVAADAVPEARRFGLYVSEFPAGEGRDPVSAVRFTPNQIFTLIAYDRLLSVSGRDPAELLEAQRAGRFDGSGIHLLTSIASSVLAELLARTYGLQFHLTAVGFKNLGKLAREIDARGTGEVILSLLEESGGAQIGPFRPWNDAGDTIHRDKDTCALALALFNLAARLARDGRTILDFYVEMARQFGCLVYFERLDCYLPDRATAESPARAAEANAVKAEVLGRLMSLSEPAGHPTLVHLFGLDPATARRLPDGELPEISLLVKEEGVWRTVHPVATRYESADGERLEFYRAGPAPHDGMRINVYDPSGRIREWTLVRASGTEAVLRVYMEIVEPFGDDAPRAQEPLRLFTRFAPLLRHLGLDTYRERENAPDYVTGYQNTVAQKYGA